MILRFGAAFLFFLSSTVLCAQVTISDPLATADDEITITYDASQGTTGLIGASRVFMHSGVILSGPSGTSWQHVVGNWGDPNSPGEMTEVATDVWEITITPRDYYAQAGLTNDAVVYRLGMVFREAGPCGGFGGNNTSCKEGKNDSNQDIFVNLATSSFAIQITDPSDDPLFVDLNDQVNINIDVSESSDLELFENGISVASSISATSLNYQYTALSEGTIRFLAVADNGAEEIKDSTLVIVRTPTVIEDRPAGIIDGINYDPVDDTKVTLSLWAPQKENVIVTGDFNDWQVLAEFQMKKDGEHFWIELTGLDPGREYGFQYLVDETIWVADPYADKILDPDDRFISDTKYPGLADYPDQAQRSQWYYNRVSVFQTGQAEYTWEVTDFTRPEKEELVIYELLVRDFFAEGEESWQNMIDTLGYFEKLGINAIQLMPVMEFNGNDSWGYNPAFLFAPDKYYGPKNDFKKFVDEAHKKGIAIILDIAINHQDIPGTYVTMYFDSQTGKPSPTSPWFNVDARHPFNVFFDFNHESSYTKAYLDTVNHYWINEYNIDGYRFDLSKGFTQRNSGSDVGFWSSYDQSRIDLLKRMADEIWSYDPTSYVILEHFADNSEETNLSNYGMMLWGNMNHVHGELLMSYEGDSDISWGYYGNRGWNDPHLVTYMESHDEERLVYKAKEFGKQIANYDTRDLGISMQRSKALASIFYSIPGPKMLWQFGELGYDISIDENGRTGRKPVKWEYLESNQRASLLSVVSELIRLKTTYPVFNTSDVSITSGSTLHKQIILKHQPFTSTPTGPEEMNAVIIANFDVTEGQLNVNFPHTGTWYDHFGEDDQEVNGTPHSITLEPGEFRVFFDYELDPPDIVLSSWQGDREHLSLYPNPTNGKILIYTAEISRYQSIVIRNANGQVVRVISPAINSGKIEIDISELRQGLYLIEIPRLGIRQRIIKR